MLSREFKLKPSRQFIAIFWLVMLASVLILLFTPIALLVKLAGLALMYVYGIKIYTQHISLSNDIAITGLKCHADGWLLQTKQASLQATLCGESTITHIVSVLRFQTQQQKRSVTCVAFRDSFEPGIYRELILAVKWA